MMPAPVMSAITETRARFTSTSTTSFNFLIYQLYPPIHLTSLLFFPPFLLLPPVGDREDQGPGGEDAPAGAQPRPDARPGGSRWIRVETCVK